jgi:hypothetical protein
MLDICFYNAHINKKCLANHEHVEIRINSSPWDTQQSIEKEGPTPLEYLGGSAQDNNKNKIE